MKDLEVSITEVATAAKLQFVARHQWHWQILDGKRSICDLWPTKFKLRRQSNNPTTKQYSGSTSFIDATRAICQAYRESKPVKPKQGQLFEDDEPVTKTEDSENPITRGKRYARADITLDGDELRIITNGAEYSTSVRLNREETLVYLRKAQQLLEIIDASQNPSRINHCSDCRV